MSEEDQLNLEDLEPKETPKEETQKQDFVPHQALHEQRELNKQLKAELARSQEQAGRMESTFQKLLSSLNEKPQPRFEEDPLGHFQARNQALETEIKGLRENMETFTKQSSQHAAMQQIADLTTSSEMEFRATHPDYDQALRYLKDVSRQDLLDQGYGPAEVEQTLSAGKLGLAHSALTQGKSPAQVIYDRAKRYGFKSNGGADIGTLAKGLDMAKTTSGGGGTAELSLKQLSSMTDDQINEIVSNEAKFKALMQGKSVR